MKKNFKILLSTDYSEAVMNAERYAVQLAKNSNSELSMIHIYKLPLSLTPARPDELGKTRLEYDQLEVRTLEEHRDKLFATLKVNSDEFNCETIVRDGNVGKEINRVTENSNMNMVVIGTHGSTGFREYFLGSHTWDIIKKSHVPVLAIPKDALYTGIKRIVFATNYHEGDVSIINFLVHFAKQFNAAITILHITNHSISKELERTLFEKFRKEVTEKKLYDKLYLRMEFYQDIVDGLNDYCFRSKTDILVMSHEIPFLWENIFSTITSTTKKMAFHTHIPLLSVPITYGKEKEKFLELYQIEENKLKEAVVEEKTKTETKK